MCLFTDEYVKQCKHRETNLDRKQIPEAIPNRVANASKSRQHHKCYHLDTNNLLHSQSILAHGFPAVLVAAGFFLEEEALREPKVTVFSLSTSNQHAYHKDDQKEKRSYPHHHQLGPLWYGVRPNKHLFTCGKKTKLQSHICVSLVLLLNFVIVK